MAKNKNRSNRAPKAGATETEVDERELVSPNAGAEDEGTEGSEDEEKEQKSVLHIPEPDRGTIAIDDLPNAEALAALGLNIRSVDKRDNEDIEQAINRALDIPEIMETLSNSPQSEMLAPRHAIQLARWHDGVVPEWLTQDILSEKGVAIIDGNRRVIGVTRLKRMYPKGHDINISVKDPRTGDVKLEKVHKSYDYFACETYWDLDQDQFQYLRDKSFDKKGLKVGDIAWMGVQLLKRDIGMSEKEVVVRMGATTFKAFYDGKGDNPQHTGVQILRRAAKLPMDISQAFRAHKNKVPGSTHPNDKDLRILNKLYEAETGTWKGSSLDTTKALVKDARIRPMSMTTDQLVDLYDELATEDEEFLGGVAKGETGSDRSDFLKKWWEIKGAGKQGRKAGTAISISDLKELEPGFADTMFTKQLLNTFIGKADALPKELVIDLQKEAEVAYLKLIEELKGLTPEGFDTFKVKHLDVAKDLVKRLNAGIRDKAKEMKDAKASAQAGSSQTTQ